MAHQTSRDMANATSNANRLKIKFERTVGADLGSP